VINITKIKFCGLRRPEDILYANKLLPDYIGFVFAPSRRQVDMNTARQLKSLLDPAIAAVGVFVNEKPELVARHCNEGIIDMIQLHGDEDQLYYDELKSLTDVPVIRAVRVKDALPEELPQADYLLFDTLSGYGMGGTGDAFDWSILRGVDRPYFLAGGLNRYNIGKAIESFKPFAVDVSSGIETGGVKDPEKMEEIIKKIVRLPSSRA